MNEDKPIQKSETSMDDGRIGLAVATNFDPKLIEELAKFDTVSWVYGKMNADVIGGGRNSIVLPKLSWKELERHVELCHKCGIKFNYLLNALCLGNREFDKKFHKGLIGLLDRLAEVKADGLTVASPYLCELGKKRYPQFEISISDFTRVSTVQQVKYWLDLGADEITLWQSVTRDFAALRGILSYAKWSPVRLRLIANNTCLRDCPFHENHANGNAHSSQKRHQARGIYIDYHVLKCTNYKMRHPVAFMAAGWIRPEDVVHYEQVCTETGNHNLTLKLTDRSKTTEFLVRAAKAYHERKYDGDLFDVFNTSTNRDRRQLHTKPYITRALLGLYNVGSLKRVAQVLNIPDVRLDNRELDGFLERFRAGFSCANRVCDDEGWLGEGAQVQTNGKCQYCKRWANKAFRIDRQKQAEWVAESDAVLEDIKTSKMLYWAKSLSD